MGRESLLDTVRNQIEMNLHCLVENPKGYLNEAGRLARNETFGRFLYGKKAPGIISWESHCHSNCPAPTLSVGGDVVPKALSDGMPMRDLVQRCFDVEIDIVSLTDHAHTNGYDCLAKNGLPGYERDRKDRHIILYDEKGKELRILRAAEFWTQDENGTYADLGVHGFSARYPKRVLSPKEVASFAEDEGAFWVFNHPSSPAGYDLDCAGRFRELGMLALEWNAFPVLMASNARVLAHASETKIPVVYGSDAHLPEQLQSNGGVGFRRGTFNLDDPIGSIRYMVGEGLHKNHLRYSGIIPLLKILKEHVPVEGEVSIDFRKLDR